MKKQIAILFDENNKISDVFNTVKVALYEKSTLWEQMLELEIKIEESDFRDIMMDIINRLGDNCRVIIGSTIVGIPYYIFEKNGFTVFEAEEFSDMLLEQVCEDYFVENKNNEKEENIDIKNIPKQPYPIDNEGNYFIDYALIQKYFPEITSKKALLPFFSNELFQSITIICSHIMPWLENFVEERDLIIESKREEGLYTLIISHRVCSN